MCAWPAARRPFHRGRLAKWWRPPYGFGQNRIENARDRLAWWLERRLTCGLGRHHSKMDSWPHCYRCGKQVGSLVRMCVYCTVRINPTGLTNHEVWCSRNLRGVVEPTFVPDRCTCLADRDPAPDAHLEGCRAWAVWR